MSIFSSLRSKSRNRLRNPVQLGNKFKNLVSGAKNPAVSPIGSPNPVPKAAAAPAPTSGPTAGVLPSPQKTPAPAESKPVGMDYMKNLTDQARNRYLDKQNAAVSGPGMPGGEIGIKAGPGLPDFVGRQQPPQSGPITPSAPPASPIGIQAPQPRTNDLRDELNLPGAGTSIERLPADPGSRTSVEFQDRLDQQINSLQQMGDYAQANQLEEQKRMIAVKQPSVIAAAQNQDAASNPREQEVIQKAGMKIFGTANPNTAQRDALKQAIMSGMATIDASGNVVVDPSYTEQLRKMANPFSFNNNLYRR